VPEYVARLLEAANRLTYFEATDEAEKQGEARDESGDEAS
jgi:hypothetical protein